MLADLDIKGSAGGRSLCVGAGVMGRGVTVGSARGSPAKRCTRRRRMPSGHCRKQRSTSCSPLPSGPWPALAAAADGAAGGAIASPRSAPGADTGRCVRITVVSTLPGGRSKGRSGSRSQWPAGDRQRRPPDWTLTWINAHCQREPTGILRGRHARPRQASLPGHSSPSPRAEDHFFGSARRRFRWHRSVSDEDRPARPASDH